MDKIRFGVLGCGYISKKSFLPAIAESDKADLIAVSSRSKIKAKKYSIYLSLSDDAPWAQATVIISYN